MELSREEANLLYESHAPYIHRTALFLTNSKTLADDITQETFIQVFRKYKYYDPSLPIRPWLYKITVNTMKNLIRRQKWLRFVGMVPETADSDQIEERVLQSEKEKELWLEIQKLTPKSKEVIILHFYAGLKLYEIADVLGIPEGTCKSRLHSALSGLRKAYLVSDQSEITKGGNIYEIV